MNGAVAEVDAQFAVEDDEGLVGFRMVMPDEIAFKPRNLELVIIEFSHDLR